MNQKEKVSWKGWAALAVLVLMFSGIFRASGSFLKAFDFLNLSGSFGTIAEGLTFTGQGGGGAKEGFMVALTIIPSVCLAVGIINVVEEMGAMKAAEKVFDPLLRPLLGIPGACGVAFVSSFTSSDVAAIMTRDLFENGSITDDERTVFVTYQYGASAVVLNTINTQAALLPIVVLGLGPIIVVEFICKLLGANIVRVILAVKHRERSEGIMTEVQTEVQTAVKQEKKPIINVFTAGCKKGFYIGVEQILPAMILGYVIVQFLQLTGVVELLSRVCGPVMRVFGLPGEAIVVLISAFFAKAAGAGTAASLYAAGTITAAQATILIIPCMCMGTLIGHFARIVLVAGTNTKYSGLILLIPLIESAFGMFLMRLILTLMGLM